MRIKTPAVAWLALSVASIALAGDSPAVRFESKVRPVLVEHCLKCHGPEKQSAGLRLDSREALLKGGDGEGPAIVPGDPDASPLIRAVRRAGDLKMPPKTPLADPVVAELAEWVEDGAHWPSSTPLAGGPIKPAEVHWSFRPVRKVEPPPGPAESAIDRFIDAEAKLHALELAGEADRRTLIRRATFDLTGLPPTPEDVDTFIADSRPNRDAFAEVVDRLLASPHYGERWGRLWLDVARYADTKGYVFTEERRYPYSYTYRDWVVEALNDDVPYDRFVTRQIAADRLPPEPDKRSLAAMGFLTVGRRFLQDQNEIIDDRIDVVTRGLLGLSVSCARCHDHKFDPIPTEDYYSLYGVFASSEEPAELPVLHAAGGPEQAKDYDAKLAERRKAVADYASGRRADLSAELRGRVAAYLIAAEAIDFNPRSPRLDEVARAGKLRPELLRRFATRFRDRVKAVDPHLATWKTADSIPAADFARSGSSALLGSAKAPGGELPARWVASLATSPIRSRPDLAERFGAMLAGALADPPDPASDGVRRWLESPESPISLTDADLRRVLARNERERLQSLERKVAQLEASHPGAPARAMVMVDKAKPVDPHVFLRGNPGRPGKAVPRRFLKPLSPADRPAFVDGSGRLELARAIATPANPLTARVMVNRIWMNHFGQGLVATPSDFGARGEPPTHPALLDWLAATFVERGWSIKAMHRLIMTSDAYRRSSEASPAALAADPRNLWLARQNRRRLDFESMRDALLSASGRLDPAIGGKPVALEAEPFSTRRTLYGFIDRYNLDPIYRTFDFPNPDTSSPRRAGTIVPQQALYLLNSPFVADQSRHLAGRPPIASGPAEGRIRGLYQALFGRDPSATEVRLGLSYVLDQTGSGPGDEPTSPWSYGMAGVAGDGGTARVTGFRRFGHWTGKGWQTGPKLPGDDGHANLSQAGGHPGPDRAQPVVIRWVAPADLTVSVSGTLHHPSTEKDGDGVRGRVVSPRGGVLGTWEARGGRVETRIDRVELRRGETLDFLVDGREHDRFDSFEWSPSIVSRTPGPGPTRRSRWDYRADLHGPEPAPLRPWESYAQALLLTNEFLYID